MYNITKLDNKIVYIKGSILLKDNVNIKNAIQNIYLDYFNDFLSIERFCEYKGITKELFEQLKKDYYANFN